MFRGALLGLLINVLLAGTLFGQDTQFSQFYANPLYLNPALTGKNICPKVNMNYRNQWPSMGKAFVTYSASYDQYVEAVSGGLGVLTTMDFAGENAYSKLMASGIYSYKFEVNRKFTVNTALQASYFQSSISTSNIQFGDQIDSRYGFINPTSENFGGGSVRNVDFSSGAVGFTEKFYAGIAVHHLLEPNVGFSGTDRLSRKFTVHGGYVFYITPYDRRTKEQQTFSVNLLMQQQKNLRNINVGFYYNKTPLVIGTWYRRSIKYSDALIILAGFQKNFIKFGYSYDITLSKIANLTGGSHELSLALQFKCKKKKQKIRKISCPTF